jgi:uncharacterized glyoxalase superfamily protein PhnB
MPTAPINAHLGAGATVLNELTDQPYGDRGGCVNDAFGIIGTLRRIARRATAPAGFGRVTLSLHPKGVDKVMAFLKQAFDAEGVFRSASPEGVIHHAQVRIGNSMFESAKLMDSTSPCLLQFSHTYLMQPHPTSEHWTLAQLPCGPRPRCTAI